MHTLDTHSSSFANHLADYQRTIKGSTTNDISLFIASERQLTMVALRKKTYVPFLWLGFNCLKLLRGSSLLFTTEFPEIPVLIWSTSGWVNLGINEHGFGHGTTGLGIQHLNHSVIALKAISCTSLLLVNEHQYVLT